MLGKYTGKYHLNISLHKLNNMNKISMLNNTEVTEISEGLITIAKIQQHNVSFSALQRIKRREEENFMTSTK